MSNLRDVKPKRNTITLNDGVEREVAFTLNAMAELEDRYGSVEKAFEELEEKQSIKAARFILWAALMEHSPELTERQVGSLIDATYIQTVMATMQNALASDMPTPEQSDEAGNDPNV